MKRLLIIIIPMLVIATLVLSYKLFFTPAPFRIPVSRPPDNFILAQILNEEGLSPGLVPVVAGDTLTATVSGITVLFSRSSDLKVQVRSLQLLLPKATMDGKTPQTIDLRFTKAVIKY